MGASLVNAARRAGPLGPPPPREPLAFHRRLPGYAPTPLVASDALARAAGVGALLVKLERERLGLPSFKVLGGSWATWRLVARALGGAPEGWDTLDALRARLEPLRPRTLVTATDGNHGRGVARVARLFGFDAHVLVPRGTAAARCAAIAAEGARLDVVDGTYDDAVARAAALARAAAGRAWLVQDTSWEGYDEVPRWVVEGYATLFLEVDEALAARGAAPPELVLVPVGVGALLAAALAHAAHAWPGARVVSVEPLGADCARAALAAGRVVRLEGPATHASVMAGLNCGTLATLVWPLVRDGLAGALAIEDRWCLEAMRALAREGHAVGESGAAALAGLFALRADPAHAPLARALALGPRTRVLLLATEGVTDPEHWARVVGA